MVGGGVLGWARFWRGSEKGSPLYFELVWTAECLPILEAGQIARKVLLKGLVNILPRRLGVIVHIAWSAHD
jgi:hypothetical protein